MRGKSGPWKGVKWKNADDRRQKLFEDARTFFAFLPSGSHVFCEEPLSLANGETTRLLGLACGAIWAAHLEFDLFWYWVNVSSWKKGVVGEPNPNKGRVQEFLQSMGVEYDEEDLYDAHCIMGWGVKLLEQQGIAILT